MNKDLFGNQVMICLLYMFHEFGVRLTQFSLLVQLTFLV